jgi:plastocyanin
MRAAVAKNRTMRLFPSHRVVLLSLLFALLAAACGGSGQSGATSSAPTMPAERLTAPDGSPTAAGGSRVLVKNIAFQPQSLEVAVGTTVTWTNEDAGVAHTVTSGTPGDVGVPGVADPKPNQPDGTFDSALPDAGDSFSFTFMEPGSHRYFCEVHPSMTAEVVAR